MVITNAKIVGPEDVIENGYVLFKKDKIIEVKSGEYHGNEEVYDAKGNILMPGFVDVHIHGCSGVDFMDATVEDYVKIGKALLNEGVTSFLATTLSSDHESILRVCKTVKKAMKLVPNLAGIHLEGPYINPKYKGAQNEKYIRLPNRRELKQYIRASGNNISKITIAPELPGADILSISTMHSAIKMVSIGHSAADYNEIKRAENFGCSGVTHLTNGMNKDESVLKGIIQAIKEAPIMSAEIICDGIHIKPEQINEIYKELTSEKLMIVTDALKAKHTDMDEFELFGHPCHVKDGAAYLENGKLAGSLLTFDQAVRNVKKWTNASLIDLSYMASINPSMCLKNGYIGSIYRKCVPDFVVLDKDLNIIDVFSKGNLVNRE